MKTRLALVLGGALISVAVATCTDLPSDPKTPFALELHPPASPSVILGDMLRDSLGALAPLSAAAFSVKGDSIGGATISFHVVPVLDSLKDDSTPAYIDSSGRVIAKSARVYATRTFRIYAQVGGLQSQTVKLTVTRRPDSLLYAGSTVDTTVLKFSDSLKTSPELAFRLWHKPDNSISEQVGDTLVPAYLVRFQIVVPQSKATDTAYVARVTDTSYVSLVAGGKQSTLDTADANGVASRAVRIRFAKFPFNKAATNDTISDSIHVQAHAYLPGGGLVTGSGREILLIVKARALTPTTP